MKCKKCGEIMDEGFGFDGKQWVILNGDHLGLEPLYSFFCKNCIENVLKTLIDETKNKKITEYEGKKWYRIVKSAYIIFFVLAILWGNMACFVDGGSPLWVFIVTNLSIIFIMGAIEGLFWYIVNGKWGYPKDK